MAPSGQERSGVSSTASARRFNPRSIWTAVTKAAATLGVIAIGLVLIAVFGVAHLWFAEGERYSCPVENGEQLRLERGGWAEPTWCKSSGGATASPDRVSLDLAKPLWSVGMVTAVVASTLTVWVFAIRAIWSGRRRIPPDSQMLREA